MVEVCLRTGNEYGTRFAIPDSRFTIHDSPIPDSRFAIHDSRFTTHDSRFTIHDSRLTGSPMSLITVIDHSALANFVRDHIWVYPLMLTLHAIGLAFAAGVS